MNKVAVVTGAGRGIGRSVAELLVKDGYAVVVTDVDGEVARRTAAEIGAVEGLAQDVRDERSHAVAAAAAATHGRLAVWVNNAGVGDDGTLAQLSSESVRRLVDTNLMGVAWGMRAALGAFAAGGAGGDVVNIASASALGPVPGLSVYAATKAAVVSLTMSAANEVPKGVRVHALCPDGVDTEMVRVMRHDGQAKALVHSGGGLLAVAEVAAAAVGLIGSRRVVRTLPGWRAPLIRLGAFIPSRTKGLFKAFEVLGRRVMKRRA
jgi:NAD(P)-dependent dehydrogenase (short-subunit alcohol dehydrogenase family)